MTLQMLMAPTKRTFSLLLAGIWIFTALHCVLEGAGVIPPEPPHGATSECCENVSRCTHDGCDVVEQGTVRPASNSSKVLAPDPALISASVWLLVAEPTLQLTSEPTPAHYARPLDWVPSWQFVRRAAPPSRAPSQLIA